MSHALLTLTGFLGIPAFSLAAFQYFDPTVPTNAPPLLSQTGLYTNPADKSTLDTSAKGFEVNSALWSDGALKRRWIILQPGKSIPWVDDTDFFDYPDSTVFVKTFLQVMGPGDTVYWETRFLMKKADAALGARNWYGFSYRWNQAQNEASLVDVNMNADTVFPYVNAEGRTTYKKWRFPSTSCASCHNMYSGYPDSVGGVVPLGRGVLGFYPAQLKRSTAGPSDQVLDLFARGVFSGARPNATQLAERFIGIHEPISSSYTAAERRWVLDRMARSYLAANCSGCHGERAQKIGGGGSARIPPNFDYFDFRQHDLVWDSVQSGSLTDTTPYTDSLYMPSGRAKYRWLVSAAGMSSYSNWSLALPPGDPATLNSKEIYWDPTLQIGYPSLSNALFRQWVRTMPAVDSARMYQFLKPVAGDTSNPDNLLAVDRITWIFAAPWGSQAWLDTLENHGFTLNSVMAGWQGRNMYQFDRDQMPPLGTFVPDTAVMKIMGEWVGEFNLLKTDPGIARRPQGISRNAQSYATMIPFIRSRTLFVSQGWTGKAQMLDIRGRVYVLKPLGGGKYAMPQNARPGLYFFRVGVNYFKASML